MAGTTRQGTGGSFSHQGSRAVCLVMLSHACCAGHCHCHCHHTALARGSMPSSHRQGCGAHSAGGVMPGRPGAGGVVQPQGGRDERQGTGRNEAEDDGWAGRARLVILCCFVVGKRMCCEHACAHACICAHVRMRTARVMHTQTHTVHPMRCREPRASSHWYSSAHHAVVVVVAATDVHSAERCESAVHRPVRPIGQRAAALCGLVPPPSGLVSLHP